MGLFKRSLYKQVAEDLYNAELNGFRPREGSERYWAGDLIECTDRYTDDQLEDILVCIRNWRANRAKHHKQMKYENPASRYPI